MAQRRYDHERWMRQQHQAEEKRLRADDAATRAVDRDRRREYIADRRAGTGRHNADLDARVRQLESLLRDGLDHQPVVDFGWFRSNDAAPIFDPGSVADAEPEPRWDTYAPRPPGALRRLLGWRAPYDDEVLRAREDFEQARADHANRELRRVADLDALRVAHDETVTAHSARVDTHNTEIERWRDGYRDRRRPDVERYLLEVAVRTSLPRDFPRDVEMIYSPQAEHAVAQVELPGIDCVPTTERYTYVATTDERKAKLRAAGKVKALYSDVLSQVVLLYIRNLFGADPRLRVVDVNGHVRTIDPATGQPVYPCLISVAVERDRFELLNLAAVSAQMCLRSLNALISKNPYAVEPVHPIREFDLTRYAFADGLDAVSRLDSRPDLLEMTPTEFEHFVRQLFESMENIEGWTTERTGDDGIDVVITNSESIIGGLTVVQVKQYSRVLGVNHIRELVGAMDEKKAGRGIIVTTAWFASGCRNKQASDSRIELIDGAALRGLTMKHLGKDVLISGAAGERADRRADEGGSN